MGLDNYGRAMKILLYFDWVGTRTELRGVDSRMKESCEETGVEYLGLYESMNEKWNFVWLYEAKSFDHFMEMASKVMRPVKMNHYITEILIPQEL
jgi:hypothetical protein